MTPIERAMQPWLDGPRPDGSSFRRCPHGLWSAGQSRVTTTSSMSVDVWSVLVRSSMIGRIVELKSTHDSQMVTEKFFLCKADLGVSFLDMKRHLLHLAASYCVSLSRPNWRWNGRHYCWGGRRWRPSCYPQERTHRGNLASNIQNPKMVGMLLQSSLPHVLWFIMPLSRYGRYGEVLLFSVLSSSQNVLHFGSSEPKRLV